MQATITDGAKAAIMRLAAARIIGDLKTRNMGEDAQLTLAELAELPSITLAMLFDLIAAAQADSGSGDKFKAALGEEAYGVFGRTGFTPSQLAQYWMRDLELYNEGLAQRAELIAAFKDLLKYAEHMMAAYEGEHTSRATVAELEAHGEVHEEIISARATIAKVEGL